MVLDSVIVIVLLAIAIVLLIIELFFLPGLSIAGFVSLVFYGATIYYAFASMGSTVGFITIVASLLFSLLTLWYFMRSRTLDKMALQTNIDSTAPTKLADDIKVGDEGVTLSRLNPVGRILVNGKDVEARAIRYVEEATPVRVTKVDATVVWVEPINNK